MSPTKLTLFYDGLCPLCSREIEYYRKRAAEDPLVHFVDIADPQFQASAHGLDPLAVHRQMHVKLDDQLHVGVDAFVAIWQRIRGFGWLARLVRLPGVYQLAWVAYTIFAWIRPWLPRRKSSCTTDACNR